MFGITERSIDTFGRPSLYSSRMQQFKSPPARSVSLNSVTYSQRSSQVSSVRKALELLGSFSPQMPSWPLSDLARHLHIPKSTAHNLLRTLQALDFVRQNQETRTYQLGPRAMELGLVFASSSNILFRARTVMNRLAGKNRRDGQRLAFCRTARCSLSPRLNPLINCIREAIAALAGLFIHQVWVNPY